MYRRFAIGATLAAAGLAALILIAGCASQSAMADKWWGDPDTGILLRYRMPEGSPLVYQLDSESNQTMQVMGQENNASSSQTLTFSLLPGAIEDREQQLEITIKDIGFNIVSDQGTVSPPMGALVGRSFKMAVSDLGTEIGCEAAAELHYKMMQDERDLSSEFCAFFSDLPEGPIKVGDSWESTTNIEPSGGGSGVTMRIRSTNTLAGFEKVDGHDCARIESEFTGVMEGSGTQGLAKLNIKGDMEGSGTWHFAYKEGFMVDDFSIGTGDGEVVVEGPQEMTIPTRREFTFETKLVDPTKDAQGAE